jgi:hypothetical protein
MPITDVLILFGIILAFAMFGVTLAWGEYQTRNLPRAAPEPRSAEAADQIKKTA